MATRLISVSTKTPATLNTLDRTTIADDDLVLVYDVGSTELKTIKKSELFYGFAPSGTGIVQYGQTTGDSTGVVINFATPYTTTSYSVIAYGFDSLNTPVVVTTGSVGGGDKAVGSITLYPAVDGTTINWIAIGA